jgi:sulfur carrier protein
MKIIVNGAERETPEGSSVAEVIISLTGGGTRTDGARTGIAVAVNDEVVPRARWDATTVREADRIEVLTAVQGG